jgi:hypothetical protein
MTNCNKYIKQLYSYSMLLLIGLFILRIIDINIFTKSFLVVILFIVTMNKILPYFRCVDKNKNTFNKRF